MALSVSKVLTKINVMSLIKWPNDLLVGNKKICGILIETAKVGELTKVVIGIGINVNMEYSELIDQEWTSIKLEKKQSVDRNSIITEMINQLCITLNKFEQEEFDYFLKRFTSLDLLRDKEFTLRDINGTSIFFFTFFRNRAKGKNSHIDCFQDIYIPDAAEDNYSIPIIFISIFSNHVSQEGDLKTFIPIDKKNTSLPFCC